MQMPNNARIPDVEICARFHLKKMPGTNKVDSCDNNMCLDLIEVRDTFGQTDSAM